MVYSLELMVAAFYAAIIFTICAIIGMIELAIYFYEKIKGYRYERNPTPQRD
jgi:hypothetical protein